MKNRYLFLIITLGSIVLCPQILLGNVCDNYTIGGRVFQNIDPAVATYCNTLTLLPLTEVVSPSGGSGPGPEYQWQVSFTLGNSWTDLAIPEGLQRDLFANSNPVFNYLLSIGLDVNQTTVFRRGVKRVDCSEYIYSNWVVFKVFQQILDPGNFKEEVTYCEYYNNGFCTPAFTPGIIDPYVDPGIPHDPSGGTAPYEFRWEISVDELNWAFYSAEALPDLCFTPGIRMFFRRGVRPLGSPCNFIYSNTIEIRNIRNLVIAFDIINPNCSDENTGSITVYDLSGNDNFILNTFRYSIDGGSSWQSSNTFSNLAVGDYTIIVDSKCACTGTPGVLCNGIATISASPAPQFVDVTYSDLTDCNANDGSISLIAAGGIPPLLYSIDGFSWTTNANFTNLPAGNYLVFVKNNDDSCERYYGTIDLQAPPYPSIDQVTTAALSDCNSEDGTISISASQGYGIFEYSIDGGASWSPSSFFNNLSKSSYTIGIRNFDGTCVVFQDAIVDGPTAPSIINIDTTQPSDCNLDDGSILITANAGSAAVVFSIDAGNSWQGNGFFSGLAPGNYAIAVRNADATCLVNDPTLIQLDYPPSPTIISVTSTQPSDCNLNDGTILITAGDGIGSFEFSIDGGNSWQGNGFFSGLAPGNYALAVRNADATCLVNDPALIQLDYPPSPTIISVTSTQPSDCNLNDGTILITAGDGIGSFEFSIDGGNSWQGNGFFSGLAPGNYALAVRNADATCLVNDPTLIQLDYPPSPTILSVTSTQPSDCNLDDGTILITAGDGIGSFEFSIDGGNSWQGNGFFAGLTPGSYAIAIRNADATCLVNDPTLIQLDYPPSPTILSVISTQPSDCNLNNGTILIAAGDGIGSFEFSIDAGNSWQENGFFSNLQPGNYALAVRNADATCLINDPPLIQLDYPPSPTIISVTSTQPSDCNLDDGTILITAGDGIGSFEFSIDGGNSWQGNGFFSELTPGSYALAIRNADATCLVNDPTLVQLDYPPSPSILSVTSTQPSDCNLNDGTILIAAGDGIGSFEFSIDGGNSWQSSGFFAGLTPGNYAIAVRNADATCLINDPTVIQLDYPPSPTIISVTSIQPSDCNLDDGTILIAAGDGIGSFEFSIDGGNSWQGNGFFSGLASGTYAIAVRNADATCLVNDPTIVQLDYPPSPTIISVTSTQPSDCNLDDGTILITAGDGIGSFEFSIDGGNSWQGNGFFSGLAPGSYALAIRNADATCLINDPTLIQLDYPPSPSIISVTSTQPSDCNLNDGTILITAGDGIGSFEFSIDGGNSWQGNGFFSELTPGSYALAIRNADATCLVNDPALIQLDYPPSPTILSVTSTQPSDCNLNDGTILITAGDGIGSFEFSIDGGNSWQGNGFFSGLAPGNYALAVRNADATCLVNDPTLIQLDYPPSPTILSVTSTQPSDCNLNDGTILITAGDGIGSFEFSIDGGNSWQGNGFFSNLQPGNYAIAVRNADATCLVNDPTLIQLDYPPSPSIISVTSTQPSDCNLNDGTILITAGDGIGSFEFSIDGGNSWQGNGFFSGLASGNYALAVRNADATCLINDPTLVQLDYPPSPTITNVTSTQPSDCNLDDGTILIAAGDGIGSFEFSIDGGNSWQGNGFFSGLAPGNYAIAVRNADATCLVNDPTLVQLDYPPSPTILSVTSTQPSDCNLNDGTILIAAGDGIGSFEFSIDAGNSWQENGFFSGLAPGNYALAVRNADATCLVNDPTLIQLDYPPSPTIISVTSTQPSDCNLDDGTILITAGDGIGSFEFSIDGGNSWQENGFFSGLAPGNYALAVRNADATCLVNDPTLIQLDYPPSPTILSVTSTQPSDCNLNDGTILIAAGDGIGSFEFSIDGGNSWQSSGFFSNLQPGNYALAVRNADATCLVNDPTLTQLDYPPSPTILSVTSTQPSDCNLDDGTILITAGDGIGSFEFSIDGGNSWQGNGFFAGLTPGTYAIAVRNADATCLVNDPTLVQLDYPPSPTIISVTSTQPSDCNLDDGTILITAGDGIGSFEFSIDGGNSWQGNGFFSGLAPGNYAIAVRNADATCLINDPTLTQLDYPPSPSILSVTSTQPSDCNLNDGTILITAGDGIGSFEFSIDGGNSWQGSGFFSNLQPGNYAIAVRNADATCLVNDPTLTQLDYPPSPSILSVTSTQPSDCSLNDGTILITAGDGIGSFEFSIDGGNSWQGNGFFFGLASGNYALAVRNADATCLINDPTLVQLDYPPSPTITNVTSTQPSDCNLNDGTILITAGDGIGSFEFSIDAGNSWQENGFFSGLASGTYAIAVRNADATCLVNDPTLVQLDYPPSPSIISVTSTQPSDCNLNDGTILITAGDGIGSFEFSIDGGNSWQGNGFFSGLAPGNYALAVRNADATCLVNDPTLVQLDYPPSPSILSVTSTQPSDCNLDDGTILITAGDGIGSFEFSIDGGNSWQGNGFFSGLASGTYAIAVRNADATCLVNNPTLIQLDYPPTPTILSVTSTQPSDCNLNDGTILITAGDGIGSFEFSIDGGNSWQSSGFFSNLQPGNYAIAVRNADATCLVNDPTLIQLDYPPSPTIISVTSTQPSDCNLNDGTILIAAGDGIGSFEFSIDGGNSWQSSGFFAGLTPGNYALAVRNADATCLVNDPTLIQLDYPPSPTILSVTSTQPSDCNLNDGTILIAATGGLGAYQFSIDGGNSWQANNLFSTLAPGIYTPVVSNINGTCLVSNTSAVLLEYPASPEILQVIPTNPSDCGTNDGSLEVIMVDPSISYLFSIDGGQNWQESNLFTNLGGGSYQIVVANTDESCLINFGSIQLLSPQSPQIDQIDILQPSDCGSNDGLISFHVSGGIGAYQYSIDDGITWSLNPSFMELSSGAYFAVVRNIDETCEVSNAGVLLIEEPEVAEIIAINQISPSDCGIEDGIIEIQIDADVAAFEFTIDGGQSWVIHNLFNLLAPGAYIVGVRRNDGTCETILSNPIVLQSPPSLFILDVLSMQPSDCNLDNGSIQIIATGGVGNYEYSIDQGANWFASNHFQNLTPGIYSILARNIDGTCAVSYDFELELNYPNSPIINQVHTQGLSDCGVSNGSIFIDASGGMSPLQYSIDGGLNWSANPEFINLATGSYVILISNANGSCEVSYPEEILLTEPALPILENIFFASPTDCEINNGHIEILASIPSGNLEYSIDGGITWSGSGLFEALPAGGYTILIRNDNGSCTVGYNTTIQLIDPIAPEISLVTFSDVTDCNANNGSIMIEAIGGLGNYQYSIDGITWLSSNTFNGLQVGEYVPQIRNFNGSCITEYGLLQIQGPSPPILLDVTLSPPPNCEENTGSILVLASGEGAIQYSITGGQFWQDSPEFSNLPIGSYQVWLRNSDESCVTNFGSVILGGIGVPAIVSVEGIGPSDCAVENGSIFIEGISNDNLQYSIDGGENWSTSPQFINLAAGIYNIMVSNADFSCPVPFLSPVELHTPSLAAIDTILYALSSECEQADGSITILLDQESIGFEFSIDQGLTWQVSNTFAGISGGNYPVWVRNTGGTCIYYYPYEVEIPNPPQIIDLSPTITFSTTCDTDDAVIEVNFPGQELSYSIDGGNTWQAENIFTQLAPNEYVLMINGPELSCPLIHELPITITYPVTEISLDMEIFHPSDCAEDRGNITIMPPDGSNYEYSIDGGLSYFTSNHFTGLFPGQYSIAIRALGSTCVLEHTSLVNILSLPNPEIITVTAVDPQNCTSPDGSIEIVATGEAPIEYSINQGLSWQFANGLFSQLSAGSYPIWIRNEQSQCFVVRENPVDLIAGNSGQVEIQLTETICQGEIYTLGTNTYFESGNYSTTLSGTNGCDSILSLNLTVLDTFRTAFHENICAGDFLVVGNDTLRTPGLHLIELTSNAGCDSTIIVNLDVISVDTTLIEANICHNEVFELNDSSFYETGHYYLREITATGCYAVLHLDLTVFALPTFDSIQVDPPGGCGNQDGTITLWGLDDSIILSIDEGETWQTDTVFSGLSSGNYEVLMLEQSTECSSSISIELINSDSPTIANIDSITPSGCSLQDGFITVYPGDPLATYLFSINGGQTWQSDNHFPNLGNGSYKVIVGSSSLECFSDTLFVDLISPLDFHIEVTNAMAPTCTDEADGSILVSVQGNGNYTFLWSDGSVGQQISGISAGTYLLTVTDDHSCSDTTAIVLADPPPFFVELPEREIFLCSGQTTLYEIEAPDFYFDWSDGLAVLVSNQNLEISAAGVYYFLAENERGCQFVDSILVTDPGGFFTPRFLLGSEGLVGESIFALEVSWPAPDSIRWLINSPEVEVIDTFLNQIELQFLLEGVYTIGLEIYLGDCTLLLEKEINIYDDPGQLGNHSGAGFSEILEYILYPNPNTGQFEIKAVLDQAIPIQLRIYRDNGVLMDSRTLSGAATYQEVFSINNATPGNYIAQIQTANEWRAINFIIQ